MISSLKCIGYVCDEHELGSEGKFMNAVEKLNRIIYKYDGWIFPHVFTFRRRKVRLWPKVAISVSLKVNKRGLKSLGPMRATGMELRDSHYVPPLDCPTLTDQNFRIFEETNLVQVLSEGTF